MIKVCPVCRAIYDAEMNYCLEHGVDLIAESEPMENLAAVKSAETVNLPNVFSNRQADVTFGDQTAYTAQTEQLTISRRPRAGRILLAIGGSAVVAILLFAGGIWYFLPTIVNSDPPANDVKEIRGPVVISGPPQPEKMLEMEILGEAENGMKKKFIKVQVTNVTDRVVETPAVQVTFYERDVKVDSRTEWSVLEMLRPGEKKLAWVPLSGVEKYDRAVPEQGGLTRVSNANPAILYPDLKLIDLEFVTEKSSIWINGRTFPDDRYNVTGILENTLTEDIDAEIVVVFYNGSSEIVGYAEVSGSSLKPGEKEKISTSAGRSTLFGTPVRFETIILAK